MLSGVLQTAGGLGLFLLGMSVLTEGLRTLADERLRNVLARSTRSPLTGCLTGALTTALLQSSSATTVAAVGLVHVGLLTFPQSLGIIFGANVGSTITGWLVALLGFRFQLAESFLPIVLIGALLRLLGRGVLRPIGTSMAGFGLIFVGVATMQLGMSAFEGMITPQSLPPDTLLGRLSLLALGMIVTLVTQSSGAGVAASLVALHAGTITWHQAAALVIGMDIGTSSTAALATIGGNIQARRTGFAHVLYNFLSAGIAFFLVTPWYRIFQTRWPDLANSEPELSLVGFHTFYNLLSVGLILPFTNGFARFIERLFPERENELTRRLDPSLLKSSDVAIQAVWATLEQIAHSLAAGLRPSIKVPTVRVDPLWIDQLDEAILRTREFLEKIRIQPDQRSQMQRYTSSLYVLDHLHRITRRARDHKRLSRVHADEALQAMTERLLEALQMLGDASFPVAASTETRVQQLNQDLNLAMRRYRASSLQRTAAGQVSASEALQRMDVARSIRRIGYHIWRIIEHASEHPAEIADEQPSR
jgi:phosphate:Na+ symporter